MFRRFVMVVLITLGMTVSGAPAPPTATSLPAPPTATASAAGVAGHVVQKAKKKPKAPIKATYVVTASRTVAVTVTTPASKATISYRTAANKKKSKTVKVYKGSRTVVLKAGSKKIKVRAKANKKYRASSWVKATLYVPPVKPAVSRWAAIDKLLASAAAPRLTPKATRVTRSSAGTTDGYALTKVCYDGVSNPSTLPVVTPNVSSLWPGALVRGGSVSSGTIDEIPVTDRLPMGIGIDNLLAGKSASVLVKRPSFTSMHDAMNAIAPAAYDSSKAYTVEVERVSTFESLKAKLGVNASGLAWDAGFKLSTDWSQETQHVFVKLSQAYFSVGVNNPQGARGVFGPSVTARTLAPYVQAGSPVGYVDSITYGREFVLVYTSEATSFDLFAAVNGAYNGAVDVTVDSSLSWTQKMKKTSVKAFGIGGNAQQGLAAALATNAEDFSALRTFVTQGATFTPTSQAAPIGYTVKGLVDNRLITLNNMDKYCVVERKAVSDAKCMTDVDIWSSGSSGAPSLPAGFTGYVHYDLNATVGGNFINLMYKESDPTDGCIREIAFSNNNSCPTAPSGWQVICKDLNAGAGGNFIWLLYTRAGTMGAVTAFEVQNDPEPTGRLHGDELEAGARLTIDPGRDPGRAQQGGRRRQHLPVHPERD